MRFLLNLLWVVFGGGLAGLYWYLIGALMAVSIVGIPWSRACFMIGGFTLWPFGRAVINRENLTGKRDIGTGPFGLIGNILWLIFAGWHLCLAHLTLAVPLAISIIGIPFAFQHLKLALASLFPIGLTVVKLP